MENKDSHRTIKNFILVVIWVIGVIGVNYYYFVVNIELNFYLRVILLLAFMIITWLIISMFMDKDVFSDAVNI